MNRFKAGAEDAERRAATMGDELLGLRRRMQEESVDTMRVKEEAKSRYLLR